MCKSKESYVYKEKHNNCFTSKEKYLIVNKNKN